MLIGNFVRTTFKKFQSLTPDPDTIYFLYDSGAIYLGSVCVGNTLRGKSGIVISDSEPNDPDHPVWLDPDGEVGPLDLDITGATVGQVPAVKSVDESGVPIEWEAVELPSGAYIVNLTVDHRGNVTADKTFAEIKAASDNGKVVDAKLGVLIVPLQELTDSKAIFALTNANSRGIITDSLTCTSDNVWSMSEDGFFAHSLGLTGATVGQTVKIKAVDKNGIPTEWEAADAASGGEWHLIRSFTVPIATNLADDTSGITWFADKSSNVFGFEINTDENGNAFSYHELYMRVRQGASADAGDLPATIYINDIKIGQWNKAQVKLVNRVGEVKISRYANTYTVSYAGLSSFSAERNWVSSPALSNGIGFINSTDGAVEGNINKFKMLFADTNYMREGYLVSLWGR